MTTANDIVRYLDGDSSLTLTDALNNAIGDPTPRNRARLDLAAVALAWQLDRIDERARDHVAAAIEQVESARSLRAQFDPERANPLKAALETALVALRRARRAKINESDVRRSYVITGGEGPPRDASSDEKRAAFDRIRKAILATPRGSRILIPATRRGQVEELELDGGGTTTVETNVEVKPILGVPAMANSVANQLKRPTTLVAHGEHLGTVNDAYRGTVQWHEQHNSRNERLLESHALGVIAIGDDFSSVPALHARSTVEEALARSMTVRLAREDGTLTAPIEDVDDLPIAGVDA